MQKQAPRPGKLALMAIFALSCFGILLFLWITFGGSTPLKPKKYEVSAAFPEATTLAQEADVRISGVKVGKVTQLARNGDTTKATLQIEPRFAPTRKRRSERESAPPSAMAIGPNQMSSTSGL